MKLKRSKDLGDAAPIIAVTQFAALQHRDQRRKGADASPYINHGRVDSDQGERRVSADALNVYAYLAMRTEGDHEPDRSAP